MDAKKTTQLLTLLIIIMLLAIAFAGYKVISLSRDYKDLSQQMGETLSAKDLIEEDLKVLYTEYDSIQTKNDSMNKKLTEEQEKIAVLLDEIQKVKASNASQIRQYRGEIETLRNIMKSYVYQIDSLNQLNNQLMDENNRVRESNQQLQYEIEEVVEHNDQLEMTVEKASVVRATNVQAVAYKARGRETDRAKRVSQIQTKFTLLENSIAEKGERTIYVRIIRPDGFVLIKNTENLFEFDEKSIAFSESRAVQYDGNFLDVVIYYDVEQELLEGSYPVELYMDGNVIGTAELLLK